MIRAAEAKALKPTAEQIRERAAEYAREQASATTENDSAEEAP